MCYIGVSNQEKIPRVATEDIPVYKIVRGTKKFKSYYFNFRYESGQEYQTRIFEKVDSYYLELYDGFHSYEAKDTFILTEPSCVKVVNCKGGVIEIYYQPNISRLNCIIPSGATYYKNKDGEFVSDRIKVLSAESIKKKKN